MQAWRAFTQAWGSLQHAWRGMPRGMARMLLVLAIAGSALLVLRGAAAAISYVSASEAYDPDPTNSLAVNRPSGVAAGDVLLAGVTMPGSNTINTPSGWTAVVTSQLNSSTNPNLRVFYRVAGGAEPTNYTFTASGTESMAIGIAAFRGIDTTNPIAASAVQANNTASTSGVAPTVTPGVASAMLVSLWATHDNGGDDPKLTVPASMTRVVGATMMADNTAETRITMAREALAAATATGTRTAALSASYRSNTASVALRPAPSNAISGNVFEDVNYGGGAGRPRSTALAGGGSSRPNVRVELFTVSGTTATQVAATTTDASGNYSFTGLASGNYQLRVVSGTVTSSRSGATAALIPVLTYRTTAPAGTAVDVTDEVGGRGPNVTSQYNVQSSTGNTASTTLAYAEGIADVAVGSANVTNVDFGFNFNTVTNLNNAGPGSLRQAITNANTLGGDAGLAQTGGATAGIDNLVFMVSNGTAAAGLRSANNYFSGGVATFTPTAALPTVTAPLVISGATQPGYGGTPLIDITGGSAGSGSFGLQITGGSSTVKALTVRSFSASGVWFNSNGNTVTGSWLGLTAAGTGASGNTSAGVYITGSGNTVGGTTAAERNVISANGSGGGTNNAGVLIASGSGNTVRGNYVGLNAAGTAAVANWPYGIDVTGAGNTIGGTAAGAGNVSAGHQFDGLILRPGSDGSVVQGNIVGGNAANTAALGNSRRGITIQSSNNTIGGSAAGAGNVIRGQGAAGLDVEGNVNGNAVLGNSIFGNTGLGIDLANNGQTTNDGAKSAGQPNLLMDYPVFTRASLAGSTLSVAGYVGSAAGQSTFASSRVEIFISDQSNPNGQGQTYLGFLTTDANGNFSGTLNGVSGITTGTTRITGTATDGSNNTSEFGPNQVVSSPLISGTVFEDIHYGGGGGRNRAAAIAAGGAAVSGATVELYAAAGSLLASTTTAANGSYSFSGQAPASYLVRVLPASVRSTRSGSTAALLPVQTYRDEASAVGAGAVTDEVGGARPDTADSAAAPTLAWTQCATESGGSANPCSFTGTRVVRLGTGSSWAVRVATGGIACSTAAFGDPAPGSTKICEILQPHLHSAASVSTVSGADVSADFGFNFDTVANTNDSGIGSLRQAITNANTLGGDASLAQAGRTAAIEHLVFMLGNGSSGGGLRSANNAMTTSAGSYSVATLTVASALPVVTAPLVIDAQTQPGWTLAPLLEINANGLTNNLFTLRGGSSLRGFVVNRLANSGSALRIETAGGNTVQGNWFGPNAAGATASINGGQMVQIHSGSNLIGGSTAAARNVISRANSNGIAVFAGDGNTIQGNYIGTNVAGTAALGSNDSGIVLPATATNTVIGGVNAGEGNLISGNGGGTATTGGIAIQNAASTGTVIRGNRIGLAATGSATIASGRDGIYVAAANTTIGGTSAAAANTITGHGGRGVVVVGSASSGVAIQGNAVHGNGGIGIDLAGDGVSANDGAKTNAQPNLLMDQPVFTSARARGNQLAVAGYVGSAASQNTFAGSRVEVFASDSDASGYGEGRVYLGFVTADANGNFGATLTMPVATLALGSKLTGTATDGAGNTSEFGANFSALVVDLVVNSNLDEPDSSAGDGSCLTASGVCTLRAAIAELNAVGALGTTPVIVFAIPGCSSHGSAGCRITPASALPALARAMSIDGTTQAGWNGASYAPIIEVAGGSAGAATAGLVLSAAGNTVRGLAIGGFSGNGITLASSGNVIAGNSLGLNGAGGAAANGGAGIAVSGSGNTVGGAAAADRNQIAANAGNGITVAAGGTGTSIRGNAIGTDAAGSAGLGNGAAGVAVAAGVAGVDVINNTIANNAGRGVGVAGGGGTGAQVQISANAVSGNAALGIDLGNDGVTANTGSTSATLPNNGINQPVITGAGVAAGGTQMAVYGYVGSGSGQAAFAGARVEFFKAAPDASGYGEGQVYLGFLTADANGRFAGTISFGAGAIGAGDALTATATGAAGNTSEFGANWTATTLAALTPGGFNAFETDTAGNATSGVIRSKTAGSAATLAIVALDPPGSALHPGFSGTVTLHWLDARNDSGAVVAGTNGSCHGSWVNLGSAGSAVFSNGARVNASVTPPASATRTMRLQMSHSANGSTVVACSNDAFAALPAQLAWVNASDADSASAGTARVLANTAATGGVVHRAGRPFTVRARALDATGALMTGYDGTPALATSGCLLPSGCSAGALAAAATAASGGAYTHNAVSYAEVGALQLTLADASFADTDAADTPLATRTIASSALAVGRFVPDSYGAAISTAAVLATANAACMASGQGATFIGQGFGWATAPQATVTARNAAGATTALWTGALMKLAAGGSTGALAVSGNGSSSFGASYGATAVTDLGGGQARVAASSTDRFLLDLPAGSVQASVTPGWSWSMTISDASEAAVSGNPSFSASATQASVAFNAGGVFHSGRLALAPGHGDARSGVRVLLQLQRWTSAGWVTATEDRGCATVQRANLGVESPSGVFAGGAGSCAAPLQAATVSTAGGRAWLALPATPQAAPGRLALRLAGATASGNSCTAGGASAALTSLQLPWLLGGSSGTGPLALATWGKPSRDAVLRRETW